MSNHRIQTAIEDSIRENRIVTLEATVDTQEWVDLVSDLSVECEDWTENKADGALIREYWGTDEDGDEWRIHVQSDA